MRGLAQPLTLALALASYSVTSEARPLNPSERRPESAESEAPPVDAAPQSSSPAAETPMQPSPEVVRPADIASSFRPRDCQLFCYVHWYSGLGIGKGLRFNNPFRLRGQLGSTPESLSTTATFMDLSVAATFGDPHGFQQGISLNASIALEGVPQEVLAPSYAALYRFNGHVSARGRLGLPIVIEPDLNLGGELALGGAYLMWSGLGLYTDIVVSLFQGAATDETSATLIPVLSLQAGIAVEYEVLP